jgi:phosphate/sulfate permease
VAYTIGKGVVDSHVITLPMLLAAVLGAILWGYFTWYLVYHHHLPTHWWVD